MWENLTDKGHHAGVISDLFRSLPFQESINL